MKEFTLNTLSNGVRVLLVPKRESPAVVAMAMVEVGSRHESESQSGIAHFVEHNVFKGTTKRPNRGQITAEIESIGGEMNAATSFEYTYYYAKSAPEKLSTILDVVMDVSAHMSFPKEDIEIERGNVIEEIRLTKDTPPRRLSKEFLQFIWDGSSLGRDILGTEESVASHSREDLLKFVNDGYTKNNLLIVVAGDFDESIVLQQVETFYKTADIRDTSTLSFEPIIERFDGPNVLMITNDNKQAHIIIGFKTFDRKDPRVYGLDVMNTILGEGFGGRLFKTVREQLGLAYYVGSDNWEYGDTGLWVVRAGVRVDKVQEAIEAMLREIKRFTTQQVTDDELLRARAYLRGKTLLGVETSDDVAGWYGFQTLLEEETLTPDQHIERLEAVTKEDILEIAQGIIDPKRLSLGVLGPFEDKSMFKSILQSL